MSLAIEKTPVSATGHPARLVEEDADQRLNVAVIFTSVEATLAALKEAGNLANHLSARIMLVVPQIVPYPLPLDAPPIPVEFGEHRFRVMASQSPVETSAHICLCRDRLGAVKSVLKPGSIVVIGGPRRWWPTRNGMLARQLRRAGYEVIFSQTE